MLSSREDAEDVLQEVFAAAFNAILADEREINVRPWLYRIARNRSLNHLRKAQAIGVDSMDVHLSEHGLTTADKVHKREEFRQLMSDVRELPETQRTALLLREIDALSYEQIAEAMETTIPSVKSLLVRARVGAGRGGRGAPAHVRGGPRRARRGRRGPAPHDAAGPPPPAYLRPLPACSSKQLRQTNRALAAVFPVGPLLLLKKAAARPRRRRGRRHRRRGRRGRGRGRHRRRGRCRRRRGRGAAGRRGRARLQGRRRARRRRDRHRGRGRGQARQGQAVAHDREHRQAAKQPQPAPVPAAAAEPVAVASAPQPVSEPVAVPAEEKKPALKKKVAAKPAEPKAKPSATPTPTPTPVASATPAPTVTPVPTPTPPLTAAAAAERRAARGRHGRAPERPRGRPAADADRLDAAAAVADARRPSRRRRRRAARRCRRPAPLVDPRAERHVRARLEQDDPALLVARAEAQHL